MSGNSSRKGNRFSGLVKFVPPNEDYDMSASFEEANKIRNSAKTYEDDIIEKQTRTEEYYKEDFSETNIDIEDEYVEEIIEEQEEIDIRSITDNLELDIEQEEGENEMIDRQDIKESIILGNTTIKGDIITDVGIQIYGAVIGNIESGGKVNLVGKVEGDITGRSVVITNTLQTGNITAQEDIVIQKGCVVNGDVTAKRIQLKGTVKGNIEAEGQVDFDVDSSLEGNVCAKSFNIRPGAKINGTIGTK